MLLITTLTRLDTIPAALQAGCRWISLREKHLPPDQRLRLLEGLLALTRPAGATLGVHDDLEAAAALGLALHLPDGGDLAGARARLGAGALIGISAHDEAGLRRAAGADYATLSPVFPTTSKPDAAPLGAPLFNRLAAAARLPVLALGGITAGNADQCEGAGIALIGAVQDLPALLARRPGGAVATPGRGGSRPFGLPSPG